MLKRIVCIALLLASVGCGNSKTSFSPPLQLETPASGHIRRIQPVHFELTVKGAVSFTVSKDTHLRFEEIASKVPVALWFLSVSAPTDPPIALPDHREILFTADLAPGLYRGSGKTYELGGKTQGKVLGVESNLKSAAYITIATLTPPLSARSFDLKGAHYEKPCTLVVGVDLETGSVDCPKLANDDGSTQLTFSIEYAEAHRFDPHQGSTRPAGKKGPKADAAIVTVLVSPIMGPGGFGSEPGSHAGDRMIGRLRGMLVHRSAGAR